jgi:hypothetical protein
MCVLKKYDINYMMFQKIRKHFKRYLEDLIIFESKISNNLI